MRHVRHSLKLPFYITWFHVTAWIRYLFLQVSCIFQEPKTPPVSQDRLSHTKISLPLQRLVLFPVFAHIQPQILAYEDLWWKTWVEHPRYIFCWFYSLFFFFLNMVKLMKQPICMQNCLGHSVPRPKRKETAHIKTQKVTVTADIPDVPVSQQGFLLWISCRTGCYVCGPPRDSKIRVMVIHS